MFIVTARLPKKRLIAVGVGFLCCCVALITGFICANSVTAITASAEVRGIKSNDDRVAYLKSLGWTVNHEAVSVEELLVPEEFDESYETYLALQNEQGFDLTAYCGKRLKRYTYEITNYPTGETGIQVSLLIYKNTVIGGEVLSPTADGFLHGLNPPAGTQIRN